MLLKYGMIYEKFYCIFFKVYMKFKRGKKMKLILTVLAILVLFVLILVIRTLLVEKKTTVYQPSTDQVRIEKYAEKLSRMIQYETVSYRGHPDPEKFRGFHKLLEELFPNVFKTLEKIDIDGNLMMKWEGTDPTLDPIIIISHQDVVPAEGTWTHEPYSGDIADGKVWGRGAGDIKNGVMCFYQAAEELILEGYRPKCDVYLGSSCTEEIGGDGAPKMTKWFKDRNIRLFMLLDEGGCIVEDPVGGVKGDFCTIGIFEKGYGDIKFTARGRGGHSSTPPKNTPIARLAAFENEVEKHNPFKKEFPAAVEKMFHDLAPYCENFFLKLVMVNLGILKPIVKKLLPAISAEAAAMIQTTIAFTMQSGSNGYNVIPQEAWVTGNLRYIPHQGKDESNRIITELAAKYDIEAEWVTGNDYSKPLDFNGLPYQMTEKTIQKVFPGIGIMPYVVTGGTDSRFFSPVCDACIRFTPTKVSKEQIERMHGIDENIDANVLPPAVDYYKAIIRAQEER